MKEKISKIQADLVAIKHVLANIKTVNRHVLSIIEVLSQEIDDKVEELKIINWEE